MIKYILKRLFISIFVLLGVSIIIYTLVRMMPNDYLDIKFSSQLQQGTIDLDQLNAFKEQYGIGDKSFKGSAREISTALPRRFLFANFG